MMKHRPAIFTATLIFTLFLVACEKRPDYDGVSGSGMQPIYIPHDSLRNIRNENQRPVTLTGTIYLRDSLFFMLEQRQGIHVYHFRDSIQTDYVTFIQIPAVTDFTISGPFLYADNWRDLVVIDIGNIYQVEEVGRVENTFEPVLYPPLYNGIFTCVDESLGAIGGWKPAYITNAECSTSFFEDE